jgi:predicted HicB family RNase H-like nuclease
MIRFSLRIPEELHALIVESAKTERRSLNAEMLHLIEIGLAKQAKDNRSTPD